MGTYLVGTRRVRVQSVLSLLQYTNGRLGVSLFYLRALTLPVLFGGSSSCRWSLMGMTVLVLVLATCSTCGEMGKRWDSTNLKPFTGLEVIV